MEAAKRKRCHRCRSVVAVIVVVFLISFWVHREATTLRLIGTSGKYRKETLFVKPLERPSSLNNKTHVTDYGGLLGVNVSNATTSVNRTTSRSFSVQNTTVNATIVVYLAGEMGNHLSILAKAFTVQLMAKKKYGVSAQLVLRHQLHPKWVNGRNSIKACFPKLAHFNFSAANTDAFDKLAREQDELLTTTTTTTTQGQWDPARLKIDSDQDNASTMEEALLYWKRVLESHVNDGKEAPPFLTVATWWCPPDIIDQYLDPIRDFFEFDKVACCKTLPDADESVFHLRNFLVEMPRVGKRLGYEELSPNKTAFELFAHLKPGDKVAITTRFGGKDVEPYVSALQGRGLQVRVMEGQSGTEDFCFLMSAQKELVGSLLSTFAMWAAYLGDMKRANLYRVMSPSSTPTSTSSQFQWKHPDLKDRVFTTAYNSEELDALEANK